MRTPDATALLWDDQSLTYAELLTAATNVAGHLSATGVGPGDKIALVSSRSAQAVIAMLGILRAGGCYVPMDPTHASEQLDFIGHDLTFAAALVAPNYRGKAQKSLPASVVQLDLADAVSTLAQPAHQSGSGADPAYVLYTSGTTGQPKGVAVPQHGVAAFSWRQDTPGIKAGDIVLHANTIACDGATFEIWSALLNGAALAIETDNFPSVSTLAATIRTHRVSALALYTGVFHMLLEHELASLASLRMICAGGDRMDPARIKAAFDLYPTLDVYNLYGPTEATSTALACRITRSMLDLPTLPIGKPLARVEAFVVDGDLSPLAGGRRGQLAIAGPSVGLGYLGRHDLTDQAFVDDPRPGKTGKIYLTGDLVEQSDTGTFLFHGRIGRQVKLDGHRIELDGVEAALRSIAGVRDAAVELVKMNGVKRLSAMVARDGGSAPVDGATIKSALSDTLPGAAIPAFFKFVADLPLGPAGKVDRKQIRTDLAAAPAEPKPAATSTPRDIESRIAAIWVRVLGCDQPPRDATFFDLGGTSSKLLEAHAALERGLQRTLPITLLFEAPRLSDLAAKLADMDAVVPALTTARDEAPSHPDNAIAIVGMAGRFPGADDIEAFWESIKSGKSQMTQFTTDELEDTANTDLRNDPAYVPVRPVLEGVDQFDAEFFDIMAAEARQIDPQARVFLEICQHALNDAGIDPERDPGAIGVFAGATMNTYLLANLMPDRARIDDFTGSYQTGNALTISGNAPDHLAGRVAFKLNLTGPAMTLGTACSTSATAIVQAVQALRSGQTDAALAGGVSITFPQKRGYLAAEEGMVAPDGVCRPFDAEAKGTVFGHGAGVVVLKRLSDALADGDRIHAVIRGVGITNDGNDKMSYAAPSVTGQARAIAAAHRDAGVDPATIGFIECHGSGTPLGDPIEVQGLIKAFDRNMPQNCALGSAKGTFGHLDAASGVTGVLKTALALRDGMIPPIANFKSPNPAIDFDALPFFVPEGGESWPKGPRRAGVSSMGVGGTNVHLVMEDPPAAAEPAEMTTPQCLPISAKSPEALAAAVDQLRATLTSSTARLSDIAYTLQDGRTAYACRTGIAARDRDHAIAELARLRLPSENSGASSAPLVFMFPGQGSQYPGMGAGLYHAEPDYRRWIHAGVALLRAEFALDLEEALTSAAPDDRTAARAMRDTRVTQPALYITQYALAQLWLAKGIRPDLLIGHSVGEITAAALSGVFDFETGLRLIARRGQLMQDQPAGDMLSVRCDIATLSGLLADGLDIAARNAPDLQVVAGPAPAVDALAARLEACGIAAAKLHTSHAFHSAMMDPVTGPLRAALADCAFAAPAIPIISTVTGEVLTDEQATSPAYWAGQARAQVNFQAAVEAANGTGSPVFLEVGAGRTLATLTGQILKRGSHGTVFHSLPDHTQHRDDETAMAAALVNLWAAGIDVDWHRATRRGSRKVSLPGYPFQRQRYWVDPPGNTASDAHQISSAPSRVPVMSEPAVATLSRRDHLADRLSALLSDMSGESVGEAEWDVAFTELGFDSLFLGQVSQAISRTYGVELTFRMLLRDYPNVSALADHLDAILPPETAQPTAPETPPQPSAIAAPAINAPVPTATLSGPTGQAGDLVALHQAQLQSMERIIAAQLASVGQTPTTAVPVAAPPAPVQPHPAPETAKCAKTPAPKKTYKFGRGPDVSDTSLTAAQRDFVADLAAEYSRKFATSKRHTAQNRPHHADPRTAAGFHPDWKELVFPIVAERAKGAHIWDLDGNRLVDMVGGFGQSGFGHAPDFIDAALRRQMDKGFAIGPQSDLAGPVARKFADMVGHDRVTFCNTGSEAVMAAMRMARTVTGRQKIVAFSNDYHGQFDEVLIKGKRAGTEPGALPVAPGIPGENLQNMVVLPYGEDEALGWIEENGADIAAVLVEPVQSRHPEHRPKVFVRKLRELTEAAGAALILDEVVTGFRTHPRGMQGLWGIKADLATYGKVIGGGMAIGAIAGSARFMGALDGGDWSYGDASAPEIAPTFVAGTFSRHPLVLAAVDATLDHLAQHGDALWQDAAARTTGMADRMNRALNQRGLPNLIEAFSSWLMINVTQADPRATLLFPLMRLEGIHVMDGFGMFMTTAHSDGDVNAVVAAFETALDRLQSAGILIGDGAVISPAHRDDTPVPTQIPLTDSQKEIWMVHQLGETPACSFNEAVAVDLKGPLDRAALEQALQQVVGRHDSLRAVFDPSGRGFRVRHDVRLDIAFSDLSRDQDRLTTLKDLQATDARTAFDLTRDLPVRAHLVRLSGDSHVLNLTAHHIVCDGWSLGVIFDELTAIYRATLTGRGHELPPAPSFADAAMQDGSGRPDADTLAYWHKTFRDIPPLPDMPLDRPRPALRSFAGATLSTSMPAGDASALRGFARDCGVTMFATLFAGVQAMVHKVSGASDIVLAVPTSGQAETGRTGLVGHCVDLMPVRIGFAPDATATEQVRRTGDVLIEALNHPGITFGRLVQELDIPRTLGRLPLTEIQFNYEKAPPDVSVDGLAISAHSLPKAATAFDLFVNVSDTGQALTIDIDYNTDLFDQSKVETMAGDLKAALREFAGIDAQPDSRTALPTTSVLTVVPRSVDPVPDALTLPDLLEPAFLGNAEKLCLEDEQGTITYGDLRRQSDQIAAMVQAEVPASSTRIGVMLPRNRQLIAALLGAMKAGHAYVPLDLDQPAARRQEIIHAAEVSAVLTTQELAAGIDCPAPVIDIDTAPGALSFTPPPIDGETSAYVMFTSGSTGTPKGVEIPHRAVVNLLHSMAHTPGMDADDRLLSVTTATFDISVLEFFLPLSVGASLVLTSAQQVREGFPLVQRLNRGDITIMQATPSLWEILLEAGFRPQAGMKLLSGGEPLAPDLAARLLSCGAGLWNMYGPTETTIWSAVKRVTDANDITIGGPIDNTDLVILGPDDQPVATGETGELNIGGLGLAKGYFNQPDLTDKQFRDVILGGRTRRLYRTGDLARAGQGGEIEVLGRADAQVKLRGFRIELEDIETRLRANADVSRAAVAVVTGASGAQKLVAFVVPVDGCSMDRTTLSARLSATLPDYMVPQDWVELAALPRTANGKLDRKALPGLVPASGGADRERSAPTTPTQQAIAAIWADCLAVRDIDIDADLISLGIDSLDLFRIAAKMLDAGLGLEARHMIEHQSVRQLAAFADSRGAVEASPAEPSLRDYRNGARRRQVRTAS